MRVDAILHGQQAAKGKERDASQRWLGPDFASRIRSQLLDRSFEAQRLAKLIMPAPAASAALPPPASSKDPPPHPLPMPPLTAASLMARASAAVGPQRMAAL